MSEWSESWYKMEKYGRRTVYLRKVAIQNQTCILYGSTQMGSRGASATRKQRRLFIKRRAPPWEEILEFILWNGIKPGYVLKDLGIFLLRCFYLGILGDRQVFRSFLLTSTVHNHYTHEDVVILLLIVNVASWEPSCRYIYIVHAFLLIVEGSQAVEDVELLLFSSSLLCDEKEERTAVDEMPTIIIEMIYV